MSGCSKIEDTNKTLTIIFLNFYYYADYGSRTTSDMG